MYRPLLKSTSKITKLASHTDIALAIISLLDRAYSLKVPKTVAWLGNGELVSNGNDFNKEIPLFRGANNIKDYVHHSFFLMDNELIELNAELSFTDNKVRDIKIVDIKNRFSYSKAVNQYVTQNDKIIPSTLSSVANDKREFSKTEAI